MTKYSPMLCKTGKDMTLVAKGDYILEEKLDGIRCIAYCTTLGHTLINRNGIDITRRFPEIVLPKQDVVLDGELCCFDTTGYSDFQLIQTRANRLTDIAKAAEARPSVFVVFDCLELKSKSCLQMPYNARTGLLYNVIMMQDIPIRRPYFWLGSVLNKGWLASECAKGLEGIIAKQMYSMYAPGLRSSHWLKFKSMRIATYEVLGATYGEGKREDSIGALLIGLTDNGVTRYVGKVGTGFDDQELDKLDVLLASLRLRESYTEDWRFEWIGFSGSVAGETRYFLHASTLYCKVKYQELTSKGAPRFPVYMGLDYTKGVLSGTSK